MSEERQHPFITGLLEELPADGEDFPIDERVKWLKAALGIFDLIYANSGADQEVIIDAPEKRP